MMEDDDPKPETKPSRFRGAGAPPRPPVRTLVGTSQDDDDKPEKRKATISKTAEGEGKFERASAGLFQYGHVIIRIDPHGRGKGTVIHNDVPPNIVPIKYVGPVMDSILDTLDDGIGNHGPILDVVVRIVGGSSSKSFSTELAFVIAAIFATKDALKKADPVPLE